MIDINSSSFHVDLRDARRGTGLNQKQFAQELGMSATLIRNYEASLDKTNARRPCEEVLEKINAYLNAHHGESNALSGDLEEEFAW